MENDLKRSLMAGPKTFVSVNSYVRGDNKRILCLNGFGRDCRLLRVRRNHGGVYYD